MEATRRASRARFPRRATRELSDALRRAHSSARRLRTMTSIRRQHDVETRRVSSACLSFHDVATTTIRTRGGDGRTSRGRRTTPKASDANEVEHTNERDAIARARVMASANRYIRLFAAFASMAYLWRVFGKHFDGSFANAARKALLEDAFGSASAVVLLLYTGACERAVEAIVTKIARALKPGTMNTMWWVSLALIRSRKYLKKIIRATLVWALASQVISFIPDSIDVIKIDPTVLDDDVDSIAGGLNAFGMFLSTMFDSNTDGTVTGSEVQFWMLHKSLRILWVYFAFTIARWLSDLKEPPSPGEVEDGITLYDHDDVLSQALNRHFAGLRGDDGIEWEVQARSALIDKTLSIGILLFATYTILNSLGVNMTGLLAIGGVSGIAIGFAAQKLVSNFISGVLIFVTQPFVEGDHIIWQNIEGTVEEVGWHSTRIQSMEHGYAFIVPNTDILGAALRNLSRRKFMPLVVQLDLPEGIETTPDIYDFVQELELLWINRVDSLSIRRPKVSLDYGDKLGRPTITLRAFIDEAKGGDKTPKLKATVMQEIAAFLRKREEKRKQSQGAP